MSTVTRKKRSTSTIKRPTTVEYKPDNILGVINNTSMIDAFPDAAKNGGTYFVMELGYNAPANWDPTNNDYYWWNNNAWEKYNGTDRTMNKGSYIAIPKSAQNPSGTTPSNSTTNNTSFNGLDLGFTAPLQPAATSPYNYSWYNANRNNLLEYQDLGKNYNEAIKNRNLSFENFLNLLKFLNPDIYKGMDADSNRDITVEEYNKFLEAEANKNKFYGSFSNDSWLNPTGKEYYTFFKDKKGLDKILMYNDYRRLLYGQDLDEATTNDNNVAAINYLINNTPASPGDDKYKLGKAYNEALQRGDTDTAKRLSLYMNQQGINHYGYNDHFDLGHLLGRWGRELSNGQTVGKFLDWVYELNKENPLDSLLLYDIVRKATKWNFDLNDNFWNSLGAKGLGLKNKYVLSHQPSFKEGGQIFRMLFV